MAKAKEATILYDADSTQEIPLEIEKNGHIFRVVHVLEPLSDDRFFQREKEFQALSKRKLENSLSTEAMQPNISLWNDLATERKGYAKNPPEWKEKTNTADKISAVLALLHVKPVNEDAEDSGELLFDEDELTKIDLRVLHSGVLMTVSHFFSEPTKAQMDEYTAILSNAPNKTVLASMKKLTPAERLGALYDAVCSEAEGYKGRVPAWHKASAVQMFFLSEIARLGKYAND